MSLRLIMDLLRYVTLGTPHIAGYSYDGKVKATKMLYQSLCDFLGYESGVARFWRCYEAT